MNRQQLSKHILISLDKIKALEESDYKQVADISTQCLNKYLNLKESDFEYLYAKVCYLKTKIYLKDFINTEISSLRKGDYYYTNDNFFQIKGSLSGLYLILRDS